MIRLAFPSTRFSAALKRGRFPAPKRNNTRNVSDFIMSSGIAPVRSSAHRQGQTVKSPLSTQTLGFDQGPLVWVDLEMTGLDARKDEIMEIAVLITDGKLELVDDGIEYVIKVEKDKLDRMDEWCTRQHGSSGLTQACLQSTHTLPFVESAVLDYVRKYIPEERVGVLAGNSVHVDRMFLAERMPRLLDHLHYRIVDVSSIKELCRRWYNAVAPPMGEESAAHRALDDIRGSIKELQWYRDHIFVKPESFVPPVSSANASGPS